MKNLLFDDTGYYIEIIEDEIEFKMLHHYEFSDALKILLTTTQQTKFTSYDTARRFRVSESRIKAFCDYISGKGDIKNTHRREDQFENIEEIEE